MFLILVGILILLLEKLDSDLKGSVFRRKTKSKCLRANRIAGETSSSSCSTISDTISQAIQYSSQSPILEPLCLIGNELSQNSLYTVTSTLIGSLEICLHMARCAKQIKKKACLHYDQLCTIFGDTIASGTNQRPSIKSLSISVDDGSEDNNDFDKEVQSYQTKKKTNVSCDTKKRKPRENVQMTFANTLTIMGENDRKKVEILKRMSTILQKLEDIDGISFAKKVKLLKEDPLGARDVFRALSVERKKDLVLNLP
ncbi:hypothetical protein VNO77_39374 [Canavalia gladiata]|uniref:Uncharacterized protein n=1 Tax=Canavalia gladiata TaxID=3824 RepID=A0AAN9PXP5_CANGL